MIPIFDKKEFYKMLLKDRLPVAKIDLPIESGSGRIEFINTPLGTLLHIFADGEKLKEIKMYNHSLGDFALRNIFCDQNLVCLDDSSYISISTNLRIEDVIGRSFLIKLEGISIIARAEFLPKQIVDKSKDLVYN